MVVCMFPGPDGPFCTISYRASPSPALGLFTATSGGLFQREEVKLTSRKAATSFGGYRIRIDERLSEVTGFKKGKQVAPSEMTKGLWRYIKRKRLGGKIS